MAVKRVNEEPHGASGSTKKRALSDHAAESCFGPAIFAKRDEYARSYADSSPYKHGVIQGLIDSDLLRSVRSEIKEHLHFTPKETDIYKIHQSGDLANLDGLDDSSLARLPSLLKLRDALYSPAFRRYISHIAGAGPVSGRKTDMAINVYTPTCHLLCHDDVIGTRRISYILYLTDPDTPWRAEWGGALRLYPTQRVKSKDGNEVIVPSPEFSLSIPPAFNQLSFFAIQPGESFHDVEEVYMKADGDIDADGGRVRMAISGWYHIPQEGEEGYEEGLEEKLAERSSLSQLQSKDADEFDLPQPQWKEIVDIPDDREHEAPFSDEEMEWLLRFINPNYLTPDTVDAIVESFEENSVATLADFLNPKFAQQLREYVEFQDSDVSRSIPFLSISQNRVNIARPPHKHRYVYRQPVLGTKESPMDTPLDQLIEHLLPSHLFAKWLVLVTGLNLSHAHHMARRFRKGLDYTLATSYDETEPQLEICLGITPSPGWGAAEDGDEELVETSKPASNGASSKNSNGTVKSDQHGQTAEPVGGYEMYMAGDDDGDDGDAASDQGIEIPSSATGAGQRRKAKADPAIYKSSADDEDDGVLFTNPASWNTLSLVLRDTGVMKFVKYVSNSAKGDRWDIIGNYSVVTNDDDDEEED